MVATTDVFLSAQLDPANPTRLTIKRSVPFVSSWSSNNGASAATNNGATPPKTMSSVVTLVSFRNKLSNNNNNNNNNNNANANNKTGSNGSNALDKTGYPKSPIMKHRWYKTHTHSNGSKCVVGSAASCSNTTNVHKTSSSSSLSSLVSVCAHMKAKDCGAASTTSTSGGLHLSPRLRSRVRAQTIVVISRDKEDDHSTASTTADTPMEQATHNNRTNDSSSLL